MLKITSRDNQRLKLARKTREGFNKNAVFIEGLRLANEVLRSNTKILDVFVNQNFLQNENNSQFLDEINFANVAEVSDKIFDSLADTKNSQGIVLICEKPPTGKIVLEANLSETLRFSLFVLLHQINNPSNLGAILRTCEAVNAAGIILTKNSADVFSPKSSRGAMGANLRLPVWTNADFEEVLSWAKEKKLSTVCADVNAEKSYLEIDWKKPRLLIFGSEAHGLSAEERKMIDENLIIPMENDVESLNLAVSAGVILFEAKRQSEN